MTARLSAITAFRLTTADPQRLARFYAAIGFQIGEMAPISRTEIDLLNLRGGGARLPLQIGQQRVDLDMFDVRGRPYPAESNAANLWFQHLAIVTSDAAAAWDSAQAAGAIPISCDGAVTLPASSGGVTAIKFRDPEGHPLELLQFRAGADGGWRGRGMLGIDHSAISVRDPDASRSFYEMRSLKLGKTTLNSGPTQVALDGLDDVSVDVLPLAPATAPPHLELLAYRKPQGRAGPSLQANDVAATRTIWAATEDALVSDPDGHLHLLRR